MRTNDAEEKSGVPVATEGSTEGSTVRAKEGKTGHWWKTVLSDDTRKRIGLNDRKQGWNFCCMNMQTIRNVFSVKTGHQLTDDRVASQLYELISRTL